MTLILVALGAFCLGSGVTGYMAHHFLHIGFQLGRDDRVLDPGPIVGALPVPPVTSEDATGPIPVVVGESSGRHAKPVWPDSDEGPAGDTARLEPVVTP